jgi:hypothetical protein
MKKTWMFFTSLFLYFPYTLNAASNDPLELNRAINRRWVQNCIEHTEYKATKNIDYFSWNLCKQPNFYHGSNVLFSAFNNGKKLGIRMKIHFKILPKETTNNTASTMLRMAQECVPVLKNIWNRYGVELYLSMDSDRSPTRESYFIPTQEVNLINAYARSNSANFYMEKNQDDFCRLMIHEVGHHFGLPDEYEDKDCPDREYVSNERHPSSIMANMWWPRWDEMDFYPRHIQRIFGSFCGGKDPIIKAEEVKDRIWIGFPE